MSFIETYQVNIPETGVETVGKEKFTVYIVRVAVLRGAKNIRRGHASCAWTVARRYNQFRELHLQMKKTHSVEMKNLKLEFPEKQFFGRFSKKLVEERRLLLEEYIRVLAENQATCKNAVLKAFLGVGVAEKATTVVHSARESIRYSPRDTGMFQLYSQGSLTEVSRGGATTHSPLVESEPSKNVLLSGSSSKIEKKELKNERNTATSNEASTAATEGIESTHKSPRSRPLSALPARTDRSKRYQTIQLSRRQEWRDSNIGYNFDNTSNQLIAKGITNDLSASSGVGKDGRISVARMSVLLTSGRNLDRALKLEAEKERRRSMCPRGRIQSVSAAVESGGRRRRAAISAVPKAATQTGGANGIKDSTKASSKGERVAEAAAAAASVTSKAEEASAEFAWVPVMGDWVVEEEASITSLKAADLFLMFRENDMYKYNTEFVREPDPREEDPNHNLVDADFLPHINFFAKSTDSGALVLGSIRRVPDPSGYLVLLRTAEEDESFWLTENELKSKALKAFRDQKKLIRGSSFLEACEKKLANLVEFQRVRLPGFPPKLAELENLLKIQAYKFAVVYAKEGQRTTEEILSNQLEDLSEAAAERFNAFVSMLGERIVLKGWAGYRGDLDVRGDSTGTHSIYTVWRNKPIMFQIVPWISEMASRHTKTGNDICVVIYQDGGSFHAPLMASTVIHNYVVVKALQDTSRYKVAAISHVGVPEFSPQVPRDYLFEIGDLFREFLLHKLVNGERSAHYCQSGIGSAKFSLNDHRLATRKGHLNYLRDQYCKGT